MCIKSHRRLSFPNPKLLETSRMSNNRHSLSILPSIEPKFPRIPFDRRRNSRYFRVKRRAARRERRTLSECSERVQVPEPSDPEERRAERDVHAPRAALLFPPPPIS